MIRCRYLAVKTGGQEHLKVQVLSLEEKIWFDSATNGLGWFDGISIGLLGFQGVCYGLIPKPGMINIQTK